MNLPSVFPQLYTKNFSVPLLFHTTSPSVSSLLHTNLSSVILKTTLPDLVCRVVRLSRTFHFLQILTPYLRSCAIIPNWYGKDDLVWRPFEQNPHIVGSRSPYYVRVSVGYGPAHV